MALFSRLGWTSPSPTPPHSPSPTRSSSPARQQRFVSSRPSTPSRTVTFAEAPSFAQDNPYVRTGYRRELRSWKSCIYSVVGYTHNETVNIWSHLVASAFAFLVLGVGGFGLLSRLQGDDWWQGIGSVKRGRIGYRALWTAVYPFPSAEHPSVSHQDTFLFGLLFAGGALCFAFSAVFHTALAHSHEVVARTRRLDYLGIFLLGNACFLTNFYYGFHCDPHLQHFYTGLMTAGTGVGIFVVVLSDEYQTHDYRRLRAAVFVAVGMIAVFPFGHALIRYGWDESSKTMSFHWIALESLCYLLGALFYAERCPEIFSSTGRFDLLGSSHQLFHILAVMGFMAQYAGASEAFRYVHGEWGAVCV
ncbi:hemolysin-III related-domain-containing protein [Leucosporidium creatinivorum]|uniref:Hemolysin-III related-domain-containing protein n=1 Tax=Leucosporidium creatinivorum TaxID=106004 RepID=A0A1Y2FZM6_9BASI|nr:hemolysin-III related-domain-containing protein [Leucosporidium creatinivorum]